MQTYLFYDIETTGLSKSFDQLLQFAAIRTDLALNEIERYELNVTLNPDIIPSPKAIITHHIGISEMAQGINEYEAIKQIHRWLNQPGTISLGYNTLGFDDEFLRFSFYRYLLPPYTHQYANHCGRMDLYPMAVMYYLFKQSIIEWPIINDKLSLKLENLSRCNQLAEGPAHNAMVDVIATLALARYFIKETDMWNYLIGYFNKKIDAQRSQPQDMALLIDGAFGSAQQFQAPGLALGPHHYYKNQQLWLRLDDEKLANTTRESISDNTRIIRKKLAEPSFILPMKSRFQQHLNQERLALANTQLQWLKQNPQLLADIYHYHKEYQYPTYPETDIDARLYLTGFLTAEDEAMCRQFHAAKPSEKAQMLAQIKNPTLYELALRIIGRHYPELLINAHKERFLAYLEKINPKHSTTGLIDFQGKLRLTPQMALDEIQALSTNELTTEQQGLLNELSHYLKNRFY